MPFLVAKGIGDRQGRDHHRQVGQGTEGQGVVQGIGIREKAQSIDTKDEGRSPEVGAEIGTGKIEAEVEAGHETNVEPAPGAQEDDRSDKVHRHAESRVPPTAARLTTGNPANKSTFLYF